MLVGTFVAEGIGEGEIVVADEEVVKFDDTLGELSAGAGSMTVSTALTLLMTNLEMMGIGSLPRGVDHDIMTLVG